MRHLRPCFVGCCITSVSKSTRAGILLFVFLFLKPLFKLFLSLLGDLYIAKRITCGLGDLGLWFKLFDSGVFYDSALSLYFSHSNISGTIASMNLVVYFFDIENKLKICFNPNFNYFFNHLFPNI